MPNLIGLLLAEAEGSLEAAGILNTAQIGVFGTWPIAVSSSKSSKAPGTVVAQSPSSGDSVSVNQAVTLTVSESPLGFAYPGTNWSAF